MNFLLAIIQTTQRGNTRWKRGINVGIKIKVGMGGFGRRRKYCPHLEYLYCVYITKKGGVLMFLAYSHRFQCQ